MNSELTSEDKMFIWQVVDQAVAKAGSHAQLFANKSEYFERTGRIRSDWPSWLDAARGYLIHQYGEIKTESLLLSILRTVRSELDYKTYLRTTRNDRVRVRIRQVH